MNWKSIRRWAGRIALLTIAALMALAIWPQPLFAYHVSQGRLALYSDEPFDAAKARAVLADAERRLETSPLEKSSHDFPP